MSGVDEPAWESVDSVNYIHDGLPLSGIAHFHGCPHAFRAEYDRAVGETGYFYIKPISPEIFALAMEREAMLLRWLANPAGRVWSEDLDLCSVLPDEWPRAQVLSNLIGDRLEVDTASAVRVRGQFRQLGGYEDYLVRWEVEAGAPIFLHG